MRRKNFNTVPFAGLNGRSGVPEVPDYFLSQCGIDSVDEINRSFSELYHSDLDAATTVPVSWENPITGSMIDTDQFNAVVNLSKLKENGGSLEESAPWESAEGLTFEDILLQVPTETYTIINPQQFYHPLEEALTEEGMTDVFGWADVLNNGGEAHVNVLFSGGETPLPDGAGDALYTGLRTGYSHLGDVSAYAEGFVQDGTCSNTMRFLTERKSRRHVGNAVDAVDWWTEILKDYGAIPDFVLEMIEQATEVEWELAELPFNDWGEMFEVAGFPSYLSDIMAGHADNRSTDPFSMTAWDAYCGTTYGLTHHFRGNKESDTAESYYRMANDLIQNPALFMDNLGNEYERRAIEQGMEEDEVDDNLAMIDEASEELEDKREQYEASQEEMQQILLANGREE